MGDDSTRKIKSQKWFRHEDYAISDRLCVASTATVIKIKNRPRWRKNKCERYRWILYTYITSYWNRRFMSFSLQCTGSYVYHRRMQAGRMWVSHLCLQDPAKTVKRETSKHKRWTLLSAFYSLSWQTTGSNSRYIFVCYFHRQRGVSHVSCFQGKHICLTGRTWDGCVALTFSWIFAFSECYLLLWAYFFPMALSHKCATWPSKTYRLGHYMPKTKDGY